MSDIVYNIGIFSNQTYTLPFRNRTFDSGSAMTSSASITDILHCGICFGEKIQPKYLNCHHSFCTECLEICYQGAAIIECPTCGRNTSVPNGIARLVDNLEYRYWQSLNTSSLDIHKSGNRRHGDFHIFIRDIGGISKTLEVKATDLIEDLKKKVHEKFRIPSEKQRLIYGGKQLEDGKRLSFYNISNGSTIFLVFHLLPSPKTRYGEITQNLEDEKLEKFQSLSSLLSKTSLNTDDSGKRGEGSFQIFVKDIDGKSKTFIVKETDLIEDLKKKVQEKIGIPTTRQRLIYGGKQLQNGKRLDFYGISKDSTICLVLRLLSSEPHITVSKDGYVMVKLRKV